jgi:hypothetical protein
MPVSDKAAPAPGCQAVPASPPGLPGRARSSRPDPADLEGSPVMTPRPAPPPPGLPPAADLITAVRTHGPATLDTWAPGIDTLADAATAAAWLGIERDTIYRHRTNPPAGQPLWPDPDYTAGRSGSWTYRTLILHRAAMPGRGTRGRGRPDPRNPTPS